MRNCPVPPGKIEDILILHENGNHFSLIVPRDGFLATEGGLDFQRMEQSRLASDTLEVDATKDVIIKELKDKIAGLSLQNKDLLKIN